AELARNPNTVPALAGLIDRPVHELENLIRKSSFSAIDLVTVADHVDVGLLSKLEERKSDLPGVVIAQQPVRSYPQGALCTHILGVTRPISAERLQKLRSRGYRGGDQIGVEGLEATYESDLRGKDGGDVVAVDARGRMLRRVDRMNPVPGHTLRLSIDLRLQKVAYDALQQPLALGHPGAAVAVDPNTGAVLLFVSTPSYDLNRYGEMYNALVKNPLRPLINRASGSHYPCGSTFKLVTSAAGLVSGSITPQTREYCSGSIRIGNHTFHCDNRSGHGSLDFEHALGASCDVYFWRVAQLVGGSELAHWATVFGLGARTGIDLPRAVDTAGIVPSEEWKASHKLGPWSQGDLLNMAIGQGYVGVSPLQLADYTAALANGGTLYRPQLVSEIDDVSTGSPRAIRKMRPDARGRLGLPEPDREAIVAGMEDVFERGGTGYGLAIPGLEVAAKTGTAEAYFGRRHASHSVFVCFAPVDHPRIAVAVLVEGAGHGSDVAGPIARRILCAFFGIHAIQPPIRTGF
ncbi:MAG TPA: penicillin-binding protein 2, partial [Chthonomonadales bacterium]|nr:penicillin-binding protein 2 [Chthonomonadales bacterium]